MASNNPGAKFGIPAFDPNASSSSGGGSSYAGGTQQKTTESRSDAKLGAGYALTGSAPSGLRSPDAIDSGRYNLSITTSSSVSALPPEQLAVLQASLIRAGLTPSTYRPTGTLDDDTTSALMELKRTAQASGMSDLDTLNQRIASLAAAQSGAYGSDLAKGGSSGGPSTSTNTTVSDPVMTDPITARNIVRDAMERRLGRAPTADEYHQFRKMLTNSEGGQDVTTTTTTSDGQGNSRTRVKRSDNTTDPSPTDLADQYTRQGALGREANTVTAAHFMDIIANRVGGQ